MVPAAFLHPFPGTAVLQQLLWYRYELNLLSLSFFFGQEACRAHSSWSMRFLLHGASLRGDPKQKLCSGSEQIRSLFAMVGSSDPVSLPVGSTSPCSSAWCVRKDDVSATVTLSLVAQINEPVTTTQPPRIFVFICHLEFPFHFFPGSCWCLGAASQGFQELLLASVSASLSSQGSGGSCSSPIARSPGCV